MLKFFCSKFKVQGFEQLTAYRLLLTTKFVANVCFFC